MARSLFFTYDRSGTVLTDAKGKVPVRGWQDGGRWGKLVALDCSGKLGTWPIMFGAPLFVERLGPSLKAVIIDEQVFADFLNSETAEDGSWTLRFWEIDLKKGWSRTITVGKDVPDIAKTVVTAMNNAKRPTTWAGAEFTHAKFDSRVMVHRWPTAAIAPWGQGGSGYQKIKERFVNLLRKIT